MDKVSTVRYTNNFYDQSDPSGMRNPAEWDTVTTQADWWWVRDNDEPVYGNPEGIAIALDIDTEGLVELFLDNDTVLAMAERIKAKKNP